MTKHVSELNFDKTNPRKHNPRNLQVTVDSLQKVGFARSIVIDEDNNILAGNGITEAATLAGIENVVEVEADGNTIIAVRRRGLTDEQKTLLKYYDNRSSELAEWDPEIIFADVQAGFDFSAMFRDDELAELLAELLPEEPPKETPPQIDKADELQKKWQTELGQLWQLGSHRLICGDCTDRAVVDRVMDGERADLHLTDPPYGIDLPSNAKIVGIATNHSRQASNESWDLAIPDKAAFDNIFNTSDNQIIFGANYFWEYFYSSQCYIIWDKRGDLPSVPFADTEFAWTSFTKKPSKRYVVINHGFIRDDKEDRLHPTQKPAKLFGYILGDFSKDGDAIADFFCGSGTTLIACENLGRRCRAVELSPAYVAVCLERFKEHSGIQPELIG